MGFQVSLVDLRICDIFVFDLQSWEHHACLPTIIYLALFLAQHITISSWYYVLHADLLSPSPYHRPSLVRRYRGLDHEYICLGCRTRDREPCRTLWSVVSSEALGSTGSVKRSIVGEIRGSITM